MVNCLKRTTEKGPICPSKDQKHPPKQEAIWNNNTYGTHKNLRKNTHVCVCLYVRETEREINIICIFL